MAVEMFIQRRKIVTLALALASACAGELPDDPAQPDDEAGPNAVANPGEAEGAEAPLPASVMLSLTAVPAQQVAIAEALLAELVGSPMAPAWVSDVELADTVYVFHRLDVTGPAYYEFTTSAGGRIVVSTGRHDSPIPAFSDTGSPIAAALVEQAVSAGRELDMLYWFNARDAAGVNRESRVAAYTQPQALPKEGLSLEALEAELTETPLAASGLLLSTPHAVTQKSGADRDLTVEDEWNRLYGADGIVYKSTANPLDTDPDLTVSNVKWIYHSSLLKTNIRWWQHDVEPDPEETCWAGCGTVAWAQVAAYLAYSDRWGNPKYLNSKYRNLYPNVSTSKTAPQAIALIEDLYDDLDALCWPYFNQSAVVPSSMEDFVDWAAAKGAKIKLTTSWGSPTGGDSVAAFKAVQAGNPVILGWGDYVHYNIAIGAGTINGARYVWVNNGQGDGDFDGWIRLGDTFYTGIINSFVAGK